MDKRAERILHRKNDVTEEKVKFTDVKTFPAQLWLIFLVCISFNGSVNPFIDLGK